MAHDFYQITLVDIVASAHIIKAIEQVFRTFRLGLVKLSSLQSETKK